MYIKKNIYSKSSRRMNMSGFFSRSSSNRRYPDPNRGGSHYRKKGLFGILSGFGGSFGSRSSRGYRGYGGYPGQGYPDQGYPGQGYQQGGQTNLSGGQMSPRHGDGQMVCPKCGTAGPGRFEVLFVVRRKDRGQCLLLYRLWQASPAGGQVLCQLRQAGR